MKDTNFNVRDFGATGDGKTLDTKAIQRAIDACEENEGGTVMIPPGQYLTGTINLCDNLELNIMTGATLIATKDETQFDPPEKVKFPEAQGDECAIFHNSLLSADDVENIKIIGGGSLDDERHHRHGPKPIALKNSSNILIRDISSYNSPNYAISLGNCEIVLIENVRVYASNADGIDLDSCRNAQIINCHIESRDDAIVLKGSLAYKEPKQSANIIISNCDMATSCCGFKMGSETNGDFKNIVISNCVIHPLGIARAPLAGIAIESVDGARVQGMAISNISMSGMKSALLIRLGKRLRGNWPEQPGNISDISFSNITSINTHFPIVLGGLKDQPIERISFNNIQCTFQYDENRRTFEENINMKDKSRPAGTTDIFKIPENEEKYPDIRIFGDPLPTWGLFARHVANIRFSNSYFYLTTEDLRPPVLFIDVNQVDLNGLHFQTSK